MADPSSGRSGNSDSLPDATLLPASGMNEVERNDVTQVGQTKASRAFRPPVATGSEEEGVVGYELLEELGRGGMGVVYKARQRVLNRLVALKMVRAGVHASDADLARFRAEAEVIAQLQHPNIVQIYEIGEHFGKPYLALELVPGGTLQKAIAGTPQPIRAAAHLVELLARAIHFAHQRGVIHRDLKPGNVLLAVPLEGATSISDPDGTLVTSLYGIPKVTDFGLAKRLQDDSQHTRSGDILGTPLYMAPEQASGQASAASPATDVYALGAILYDLLTGRPPFKGATTFETIQQVLTDDPLPPGRLRPRLPKDLERICLKCLEKDPRRRYVSALDLAADLRRHLNGESVHARPAPLLERLWRWVRRNPVPASLLLALTLGAGLGFWHLSELSKSLVRSTALESAGQQTETLDEMNRYYSRVAAHLHDAGVEGSYTWEKTPGELTMPPPATVTIDMGQQISARSESGIQIRLYSEYPFKHRISRPPPDEFEREALAQLRKDPTKPFYRFEEMDGRPVLRYATARVMEPTCVQCHNAHPDRTANWPVWKKGDVRGVLEVIRPLDRDQQRIHQGLRSTFLLVAGSGAGLLSLSIFLIYLGNRRNRGQLLRSVHAASNGAPPVEKTEMDDAKPASTSADQPDTPQGSDATAASVVPEPVQEQIVVVWRAMCPIGTLTPVRLAVPTQGTLRLALSAGESPVELRAEVTGGTVTADSGIAPCVEVAVQTGSVVLVRIRSTSGIDAQYLLTTELLVSHRGVQVRQLQEATPDDVNEPEV